MPDALNVLSTEITTLDDASTGTGSDPSHTSAMSTTEAADAVIPESYVTYDHYSENVWH